MQNTQDEVILCASNILKVFPGTRALDDVTYNVRRGKVNVLVGENGAGKSTLMKILAGVEQATSGKLTMEGQEIKVKSPLDAARYGIGIIYQEMNLFPNLSVAENIFMAHEIIKSGMIDHRKQIEMAGELIERLEHRIDAHALVGDLRLGQQQIVEIAKALAHDARILIMDEPTSALSAAEVDVLFKVIRELKANGVSIVYISHKLEELLQIGDFVTVLRDGRLVADEKAENVDVPWIIEKMVGKNPASLFKAQEHPIGEELLRVEEMTLPRHGGGYTVNRVSLTVHKGEILGIYGLMGAGRSELFECLAGMHPEAEGCVYLNGVLLKTNSVSGRIQEGVVLVPEDRQRDGLVQTLSVAHNMLLASLKNYLNRFYLASRRERSAVNELVHDMSIKVSNPQQIITSLSGGNQQKVVVAKGLLTAPRVLMLDEPTRGIDVAAKSEIFEIMNKLALQGYGILFISSELKEVLAMSDRILVMSKGIITGEFGRSEATEEKLVAASAVGHGINHSKNARGNHGSDER